ncbi:CRP-like cAMP-binding protein [Roseovarius halotolerans]|uniref:Global nitrogen regulator n=1 Tax=Roseovarius halotolerans TaxID=505353 RepID=A0A1X6Y5U9_9RHOB|nr:CRP-like cAMP-binding protein [Roseovarius halotolerans]SLN11854.1 Global nitrogen regulator [Roseovarius halotolerans]
MVYEPGANIALSQTSETFVAKLDESLLTGLPPFSRLNREQIREILDHATSRRYDEGTTIFREGHDAERFYLLLDGYLRVVRTTPGGDQIIVLHIAPGQLFGIAPALQRDTYPASAIAAAESIALSWPVRLWADFTASYEGFATESYKTLGTRLGQIQETLTEMATQAVEKRVASAVLRLVNQSGRKTGEGIEIAFPVTRQNISDMTGTTLHTVSRLLSAWEKSGIVRSTRKHVVVTDPHRLVLLSDV